MREFEIGGEDGKAGPGPNFKLRLQEARTKRQESDRSKNGYSEARFPIRENPPRSAKQRKMSQMLNAYPKNLAKDRQKNSA